MEREPLSDVKAEIGTRLYESVQELVTSIIEFDYWGELDDESLRDFLAALTALDDATAISLFEAIARQGSQIVRELEGEDTFGIAPVDRDGSADAPG